MADISALLANAAQTNADFDLGKLNQSYWQGRDQYAKNDLRDAFQGGVPIGPDGQPDFASMAKTLFQKGGLDQGILAAKLGLEQQNQRFGQGQSAGISAVEGGAAPNISPSMSRSASTPDIAPRGQGGQAAAAPASAPQGGPTTIMQVAAANGIPNSELGNVSGSIARMIGEGVGPNGEVDMQDPRVRGIIRPALEDFKRRGIGQVAQNQPQAPQPPVQQAPMAPAPVPTQAITIRPQGQQPAPVTDRLTTTEAPQTPSRTDQMIAFYSGIMSDPRSPKQNVELAKTRLEALQKSSELTPDQKNYAQYRLEGGKGTMEDFLNRADENTTQRDILTKSLLPRVDKSQETALASVKDIDAIHNARTELDQSGGVFSGKWGDMKLQAGKVASLLGIGNVDKITNTESYGAAIGQRVAAMVKAFGSGTAISDGDRKFAAAMAGGNIELNETSMRRILDIGEKADRALIDRHNSFADKVVKSNEGLKSARDTLIVEQPGAYKKQTAAAAGAPQIGEIRTNAHGVKGKWNGTGYEVIR